MGIKTPFLRTNNDRGG